MSSRGTLSPAASIEQSILFIRSQRVMLDADLAVLYGVSTRVLNQAVKRNRERFPEDFMFRLTVAEKAEVITNCDHLRSLRFSPALPHAFTEHGAIMLASVLNTPIAVQASVQVVRAFVRLREMLTTNKALADKFAELERKVASHDEHIQSLFEAIRHLMAPAQHKPRRTIGFRVEEARPGYRTRHLRRASLLF
ncbi:ORF6N domain-containing protein [Candidatus Methylomirabilis sp.]|uniref:ORF6N domain-containing protein n=1 Tax=Candidatus Methylomirabilis sp. TaxID=2032687 RepID=UPI002A65E256|nr:ORF6N domain-containing protein [Candidatus Methylomirabilis sp.]